MSLKQHGSIITFLIVCQYRFYKVEMKRSVIHGFGTKLRPVGRELQNDAYHLTNAIHANSIIASKTFMIGEF